MKGVSSKQEDSDGLILWLARPPAYAGALFLYAVAVCIAGVLEAAVEAVEVLHASLRFR
ncbi:MAG: hypothetical protein M3315_08830 [Actinomycetota bacterium]|nr:hypothetical protein [Actinomycetota bacterium]